MTLKVRRSSVEEALEEPDECPNCEQTDEGWHVFDYPKVWILSCKSCYSDIHYEEGIHFSFVIQK